ncbi:MAG: 23S rRNA (adenine(2503)-C(2))-methyltransferase RlmN [Peptoniphilus sp.]|uniref:23S rRNA (adenine(2503)-C(2))-methyltransferase RlmN n=1 Tax=Peptoniphilus sp. TaxID=1971214 RepID=UPI0025D426F2|nr:23S rRNA (adenine(2503)-C(2))-methyltransferase RlmN [Peptoniphilus sp.]MCI5643062.1 23S rRNA (adenine(2503)-C(2))-methyltransferase RlmN [Peptoniphilus sp.]MDD7352151.1 23S rRNA (adenine(2503)-C(2))-methyltransferase RlmN [Peptoniphilaceae bacterium]MDY3902811.1 23S rRNA (adenine(2503)-C(2))-methyltransferase RlmN [Peptoniphilus sp.]
MELNSMYEDELRDFFEKNGEKAFRGSQLFTFFHDKKRCDIENSNLSAKAISIIKNEEINKVKIYKSFDSKLDETKKFLFKLKDENLIEGVLMEYKHGYSQCISTQVGCRMGCDFCASTKSGLVRNLTAAEMLSEVYEIENRLNIKVSNFILMGSGEPLDNFQEVMRFIKLLHNEKGHNTSYRNITISTCGVADKIYELADYNLPINLAISLHQTNDCDRSALMPINRKFNLAELKKSLEYYVNKTNNRITFEYTLIKNQNDGKKNIEELYNFAKNLKCHINLIPLNPIDEFDEKRPSKIEINEFKNELEKRGFNVTIRRELGRDISASCGQLRRKVEVK